ncbi:MAG TPA: CoA-transferase [Terriglobales bacterium]|jgi:glutaconate CoA-transferase subunit A
MSEILTLEELAKLVPDGVRLGIGGVHLSRLPIALIRQVLANGKKDFVFTSWGGGLPLELSLEANAVRKLIFTFSSLDIFGLAPRFRDALENKKIEIEEWTALAMQQALHAAHFNLPEMPFQIPAGSDLMKTGTFWRESSSVLSGEPVAQARRLDVDALLLHAQRADRAGNIEIQGARGFDPSLMGAAKKILVTVEEVVETGTLGVPLAFVLPKEFVTAVAEVPWGAYPTSCLPYYSTDYQELLNYVEREQRRNAKGQAVTSSAGNESKAGLLRGKPDAPRRKFLSACAQTRTSALNRGVLSRHRVSPATSSWTIDELMAVSLSREYDNSSICSVGSVSPLAMVSYLLAKKTHAPRLTIIALNGGFIDIDFHPMSLTLAEPLEFGSAKVWWGGDETYHWYYQQGRITHEIITVAQLDVHGRTNNAWITSKGKAIRLPGQGGMADVANLHKNFILYLTRHSPERFIEAVEFCTASRGLLTDSERTNTGLQPGKVRLISDLGIFELDHEKKRFRLVSVHPGTTLDQVRAQTGGDFLVTEPLPSTQPPSDEDVRLIREEVDTFGIRQLEFVPSRDRLAMIQRILDAEAEMIRELQGSVAMDSELVKSVS